MSSRSSEAVPFWAAASLVRESNGPQGRVISMDGMESWTGKLTGAESDSTASGTPFQRGDVLFGKLRPYLAKSWLADESGTAQGDIHVYRPHASTHPKYLAYIIRSREFVHFANAASEGVKMPRVEWTKLRSYDIPLPDLPTQRRIADYLDHETAQIDAMAATLDELVARLEERRRATIHRCTFLGLNNEECDDSNYWWAPHKNARYRTATIRSVATMKTGHTPARSKDEYWKNTTIPWFTLADVWQLRNGRKYVGETESKISELGLKNSAAELLPTGTVILSRTASVGFAGITDRPLATSQDYWNWVCGPQLAPEYLWYQMQAMSPYFTSITNGSTHKTIYQADAAAIGLVIPPLDEQRRIADYLDAETAKIDAMIAKAGELRALLDERRNALITATVTGQHPVPEEH